jgi:glycosyltransferase involved in cell wall biosynthesis
VPARRERHLHGVALRRAIAEAGPFDGYVLNSVQFAGAFEGLFDDRPSIFVAHNVEHVSAIENAIAVKGPFERLLFRREARLLKHLEARLCGKARFVFTLAEEDRAALGVASDAKSVALPLVTRPNAPPLPTARRRDCDAALVGTWTWQPNRIGLDWFLGEVVPHLRREFRISIAGSVPAGVTSPHPGVTFVGRVPDAQDFVGSASVVPLISRAGTGVQLKTIEAFELGLPTVATNSSLRGISNIPANCLVADDPATFAAALERAADSNLADADGSVFYHRQRAELDARVGRGLEAIGYQRHEALA